MKRQTLNVLSKWLTLLGLFLFAVSSFAINGKTTYQAKIIKPDGHPLESASVNFRFTVLDQSGSCAMYIEDYAAINMTDTGGLISFPLGTGARAFPTSGTAQTFQNTFDNSITSFACQTMGIYNSNSTDTRKIVMQFNDGGGWQTLPAMSINAVPYAMFATRSDNSRLLNNKTDTAFVEYSTIPTCTASQALQYTGANFVCVAAGGSGGVTSGDITTALGYTPADASTLSASYTTQADFSVVSGAVNAMVTSVLNLSTSVGAITSSQWSSSGTNIFYDTGYIGIGTANPQYPLHVIKSATGFDAGVAMSFDGYVGSGNPYTGIIVRAARGTAASPTAILNGDGIGIFGIRAYGVTKFADTTTANITALATENFTDTSMGTALRFMTTPNSSTASVERMRINHDGNIGVGVSAPVTKLDVSGGVRISMETATCAASFAGTLRYNSGLVEYCNGSSWSAFGVAGAGITLFNGSSSGTQTFVTGITGTNFNITTNNGVHSFNIPLAATGSVTAGLLSNVDYVSFSNKVNATSAAIISALGYTPANNAASGTYAVKSNNLSDLTSATVARSNLGLGSIALLNSVDLSGSQATGTLAAARLPAFSGDATSSSGSAVLTLASVGSGVTSGSQYTKVTVDGKGRVTSGAQLSVTDVTTALGYTPASTSASTQWITSGTTINYSTGNVGIGNSSPQSALSIGSSLGSGYALTANSTSAYGMVVQTSEAVAGNNAAFWVRTSADSGATNSTLLRVQNNGKVGLGVSAPTASLHLTSGSTIATTAPLKFTSGSLMTAPEAGAIEFDGTYLYLTDGANSRKAILTDTGGNYAVSHLTSSGNITFTPNSSVVVSSTTNSTSSNTGAFIVKGGMGVGADLNVAGIISGSSIVKASGYRANQGVPNNSDNSTNGYAFGLDGDTGLFSPGAGGANGVVAIYNNNVETMRINPGAVGIGTSSPSAVLQIATATQNIDRIRLTGQEFYQAANSDDVNGVSLLLGANRSGNRQLWIADSSQLTPNTSNTVIRINPNSRDISAFATDGVTSKTLSLNASGGFVGIGNVSPVAPLTVGNSTDRRGYVQLRNDGSSGPVLQLYNTLSGGRTYNIYSGFSASGTFDIADLTAGNISRLTITASGHVGVGTVTPQRKLHVSSASSSDGLLLDNGTSDSSNLIFHDSTQGVSGVTWNLDSTNGAFRIFTEPITSVDPLIATNGSERLTILPSGEVGIGTTNPVDKLHVFGVSTVTSGTGNLSMIPDFGGAAYIQSYQGVGVFRPLKIDGLGVSFDAKGSNFGFISGNVGIGTTGPAAALHLVTQNTASPAVVIDTDADVGDQAFKIRSSGDGGAGLTDANTKFIVMGSGNVGIGTSNPLTKFTVSGGDLTVTGGGYPALYAHNTDKADGTYGKTWGWMNYSGGLYLNAYAATNSNVAPGAPITAMYIQDTTANVGIGTASPTSKLEVRGGNAFIEGRAYIYSNSGWGAVTPSVTLALGDNDTGFNWISDGEFQVYANNQPRMHFDLSGNTGVGTTDPQYSLDVAGNFRVGGQAYTNTGAATFTVLSDVRYKDVHGNYERGLNDLLKVETIRFNYKKENPLGSDPIHEYVGLSAQNLQTAIPEAVEQQNKEGIEFLTVNTSPVIYAMINSVKELYYKIVGHDREIASLKAKNQELESKLKEFDELKAYICKKDPQAPNCK